MSSRDQARAVAQWCAKQGKQGYGRSKRGFVYVITSDKIIQAVLTGSVTFVIFSVNEGIAAYIQLWLTSLTPFFVPVKIIASVGGVAVFAAAYWADQHTEEWREYVREKTGADTAEDTASEEDVTGEEKA